MNVVTRKRLPQTGPLRAGSFIVTLFGDVVAPRGGEVGIRDIICFCAAFGLSETLIRTAMSRLVAAGQVQGFRQGRRSYYALTDAARAEYAQAAAMIYGDSCAPGWRFLCFPGGGAAEKIAALSEPGFVAVSDLFALGPDCAKVPEDAIAFAAQVEGSREDLRPMVARLWPLDGLAEAYLEFLELSRQIASLVDPDPAEALALRVLLVHAYRKIALSDPRLAPETLPNDWPGHSAREAFATLYLQLSPAADSVIGAQFSAASGPLAQFTPETRARCDSLEKIAMT